MSNPSNRRAFNILLSRLIGCVSIFAGISLALDAGVTQTTSTYSVEVLLVMLGAFLIFVTFVKFDD
jgi:hypothetical protein